MVNRGGRAPACTPVCVLASVYECVYVWVCQYVSMCVWVRMRAFVYAP